MRIINTFQLINPPIGNCLTGFAGSIGVPLVNIGITVEHGEMAAVVQE